VELPEPVDVIVGNSVMGYLEPSKVDRIVRVLHESMTRGAVFTFDLNPHPAYFELLDEKERDTCINAGCADPTKLLELVEELLGDLVLALEETADAAEEAAARLLQTIDHGLEDDARKDDGEPSPCPRPLLRARVLPAEGVDRAVVDGLVDEDLAVADLQVERAVGIGAHPGLVLDGSALVAEVGQGHQVPNVAFLALGEIEITHHRAPYRLVSPLFRGNGPRVLPPPGS